MSDTPSSEPSLASWMREARERLDAATPGPWSVEWRGERQGASRHRLVWRPDGYAVCETLGTTYKQDPKDGNIWDADSDVSSDVAERDAAFIAHAPEDLRRALDEIDRLNAAHAKVYGTLHDLVLVGVTKEGTVRASFSVELNVEQVRAALSGRPAQ